MRRPGLAAVLATAVCLGVAAGGCVSMPLPPAAGSAALPRPLALTVAVEPSSVAPFAEELLRSLRASGAFERVEPLPSFAGTPDLVARVAHGWEGTAAIPFFTVVTLGIVPTVVEETHGLAFSFSPPGARERRLVIDTRWRGNTWLGLAAAPLNALPDRGGESWRGHPRWLAHLRAALAQHGAELEGLARSGTDDSGHKL